jgi:hypothetical protein
MKKALPMSPSQVRGRPWSCVPAVVPVEVVPVVPVVSLLPLVPDELPDELSAKAAPLRQSVTASANNACLVIVISLLVPRARHRGPTLRLQAWSGGNQIRLRSSCR